MAAINHWPWSTKSIPLTILLFLSFLFYRGSVFAGHGQFLLITDFHLDNQYDQLGNPFKMCHRENETPKRTTGQQLGAYGDHDCDAPPALVEFMLDEAKRHLPEPDFIIWTGDNPAHVDYTRSEFLRTMKDATESMRKHFDNILVIPVLGNHDFLPSNNFDDNPEEFWPFQEIFEMWKDWIGDEAKETFTHGGYYRFKSHGADFLVLNTNVYYMWNTALDRLSHPDDPLGQFSFIEEQLADIKRLGGKINIIAHVPPGAFEWDSWGTQWSPMMPKQYNQRLVNLFVEYAPNIRWMLFGHFHTDTFRILKDANEKPVHVMFMNPSVTPIFQLNNPAFRVFEYNITDMEITDIKTFYVDLDQLNKEGAGRVHSELEYSMREAYNLDALNAETMNGVLERMAQNQSLFLDYAIRNKVQFISPNSSEPDRAVHLCVMGNVDLDELEHCLHSVNAAFALRRGITTSAIFVFFSMVFTFLLNQMLLSNITFYTNFYSR